MKDVLTTGTANDRIVFLLRDVTRAYHRYTAVPARRRGVGVTELLALGSLRDESVLTPGELAERLGITTPSVTALVDRLEAAGFAHRLPHPRDRRSLLVELAAAGQQEVEEIAFVLLRERPAGSTLVEVWQGALSLHRVRYETRVLPPP
jgi:DNA-binding MarR family transcriptional regulator